MNRRTSALALLIASLVLPLSACGALQGASSSSGSAPDLGTSSEFESAPEVDAADGGATGADAQDPVEAGASVIQTGWISIEVDDPESSATDVTGIAEDLGGYVENLSVDGTGEQGRTSAEIVLRVPSERFEDAFSALDGIGDVGGQGRSAEDVTAQHVDLQARVAALQDSVDRLSELMRGAASTSELIEAEAALSQRQQELDGLRAQLDALEDQVDDATIHVSLFTESIIPSGPANFWDGLLAGAQSLATAGAGALIVLGILLPWLAVAGVITLAVLLVVRAARTRKRRRGTDEILADTGE